MLNSQSIKVGDMVRFFWTSTTAVKVGQVISITGDMCEVFVEKEQCAYGVEISKVKKI